jgi:RNA polymerase sigma-70 factor (ECF subfamily)
MRLSPPDINQAAPLTGNDYALMAGICARDSASLAALYERYSGAVYGLCLRALTDPRDAEDLLIDIFAEIWERGDRYDPDRGSPIGHIMGLARSRVIDRLRSRRSAAKAGLDGRVQVEPETDIRSNQDGPLDSAIGAEQAGNVVAALQTLSPDQRQALELAFFEAMSHSEIAERLGQPLGTVKSRIRQALIQMRTALGQTD